jgi:hypothetical protein
VARELVEGAAKALFCPNAAWGAISQMRDNESTTSNPLLFIFFLLAISQIPVIQSHTKSSS